MKIRTFFFVFSWAVVITAQLIIALLLLIITFWLNSYCEHRFSENITKLLLLVPICVWQLQAFFCLRWIGLIPEKIKNSWERYQES